MNIIYILWYGVLECESTLDKFLTQPILQIENAAINERVMQEQLESQVVEITNLTNQYQQLELSYQRKSEQLQSWKTMHQDFKYKSETKYAQSYGFFMCIVYNVIRLFKLQFSGL